MSAITITLDYPPRELSPNYRPKYRQEVYPIKRAYRLACKVDALNARDCKTEYPLKGPIEAHAVFVVNKGPMPDGDNCLASLKAGIDGVCDAGILKNDRDIASWSVSVVKGPKRHVSLLLREIG